MPAWPDHLLTLDEWEQLPEYERFLVEVAEGELRVSPRPIAFHQRAVHNLVRSLNSQLPQTLNALGEVELLLQERPLTVRIPDVLVLATDVADMNPARVRAVDVHLVVEVLSEGSVRADRVTKFSEYADAGIARYWIVDLDRPASLAAFSLTADGYRSAGEFTGTAALDCAGNTVTIDLEALTTR
ncbi:Uma2 family endonuclease [Skermania sp. ID1734]|uniref:Uma2 family endonuclease n=1 Tax=Skermania sp. ID1734 TaxID=2597516 RepID=UPI002102AF82|nr:Uma2 family endonuclease [Skermania sp. ID1734]